MNKQGLFKGAPTDADLVYEGITYLGNTSQPNDYAKARSAFEGLLKSYPESKWKNLSETLIRLIDNMQSCQEKEHNVRSVQQENERLKREIRALNDKLQAETSRLQLLKDLEIQLDKREKMLR